MAERFATHQRTNPMVAVAYLQAALVLVAEQRQQGYGGGLIAIR
jgi:hypothetical protein